MLAPLSCFEELNITYFARVCALYDYCALIVALCSSVVTQCFVALSQNTFVVSFSETRSEKFKNENFNIPKQFSTWHRRTDEI